MIKVNHTKIYYSYNETTETYSIIPINQSTIKAIIRKNWTTLHPIIILIFKKHGLTYRELIINQIHH